jgi:hypothetical protein
MPFQLRFHEDSTTGLVAICDICGKRVEDGSNGLVVWQPQSDEQPGTLKDFRIVCKGNCDRALGYSYSQELDTALVYLMNNTGFDLDRARRKAELLNQLR